MTYQQNITEAVDRTAITQAVVQLEAGELVAFPTETVYGLGADAMNPAAVNKVYAAKGRPTHHPLIVHIAAQASLTTWVREIPPYAQQLIDTFWPGPLTLVLARAAGVPLSVTGGQDSIALRSPAHPCAQALLTAFRQGQGGIVAPSANKFGKVSPTTAAHVREEFPIDHQPSVYLLEAGATEVGIESTILDLSRLKQGRGPVLLRPGIISAQDIAAIIGVMPAHIDAHAPRSSGTLAAHYAPRTPLRLLPREQLNPYIQQASHQKIALICTAPSNVFASTSYTEIAPTTSTAYAHYLYAILRRLDRQQFDQILIEQPPQTADWDAVNDRLSRAAAAFSTQ